MHQDRLLARKFASQTAASESGWVGVGGGGMDIHNAIMTIQIFMQKYLHNYIDIHGYIHRYLHICLNIMDIYIGIYTWIST